MSPARILFLWLLLLFALPCTAQDNKPWAGFGFDVNVFTGKVIKHTSKFRLPVPERSTGLDLNLQWKTYGKRPWEQRRRYPTVGIALAYTDYGIDSVYGKCFSIYPNIEIPVITGKSFEWTIRIGDGAGFVTKKYRRQIPVDTLNNAIGSTLNDYASFMSDIRYHINDHWYVQAGINFSHISNASYHQPNLGVNLLGAHIGVKYFPVTSKPKHIVHQLKPLSNRWLAQFRMSVAFQQSNAPLGPTHPVYLATALASKRWISKNKLFVGVDYSYHTLIAAYLRNNGFVDPGMEERSSYKVAALVGNEFLLGRVGVLVQAGYYLKQAFQTQGKVYQKIGGNYYFVQKEKGPVKEVYLCAFLKTHVSVAELAEFGFGMSF
ncbi:MAG: acyloxyacyl hydrolase [Bacteroidota bacterium]